MKKIYDPCHLVGGMTAYEWERDPKRLAFILARYKFVAKMLEGKARVLEIGCADGFGSRIVRQSVGSLTAIDLDVASINEAKRGASENWPIEFVWANVCEAKYIGFDAVYALDVLEHIHPTEEQEFLESLRVSAPLAIIGCPSLESQVYASALSKEGHVNCKNGHNFRETLRRHWGEVFVFGMNDETLHTGFDSMQHYRLAICC